ncbi:hypothetical protein V9T40_007056 [Parthenolecanium corni]|uniref:Uncharacterized protein n=1 Tax=Parthenolecanium corni TaxID=536013 RepID=A0AAN9U4K8_9HEMI
MHRSDLAASSQKSISFENPPHRTLAMELAILKNGRGMAEENGRKVVAAAVNGGSGKCNDDIETYDDFSSFFDLERDYEKEPFRSSLPKRVSKDECTTYQYIIPIGENVIMENRYKGGKPATQTKNSFPTSYNIEKPLDLPVVKINTRPKKTANDP